MWQELRAEFKPRGLEVVTVALDTGGAADAGAWIDAANPEHPSLIDEAHLLDELLGVVNVPSGIWIDEEQRIVRPPEPAWPGRSVFREMDLPIDKLPPILQETLAEASKIRANPQRYLEAVRDWVEKGAKSEYVLEPDEVVERSRPRPLEASAAAANFELGQHLHRAGKPAEAVPYFREAHRLEPDNWTYKRQAWSFADPMQGRTEAYEGSWLDDVREIGAENYYPPMKP